MKIIIFYTIIFAFLASLFAKIGVIISCSQGDKTSRLLTHTIGAFGAGFLLGSNFLYLLPYATNPLQSQMKWALLALMLLVAIGQHSILSGQVKKRSIIHGLMLSSGYVIQYLTYGIALTVGFKIGNREGIVIALGIILHQYPESMAHVTALRNHWPPKLAVISAFLAPFTIPIGAAISLFLLFSPLFSSQLMAPLSGIAVGLFVFFGLFDLLKGVECGRYTVSFGILGVIVVFIVNAIPF